MQCGGPEYAQEKRRGVLQIIGSALRTTGREDRAGSRQTKDSGVYTKWVTLMLKTVDVLLKFGVVVLT